MTDHRQIEEREGALTFARIVELQNKPIRGNFDVAHLQEMHKHIFQDLPHYAPGEFRDDAPAHTKARGLEHSGHRYYVPYAPRSEVDPGLEKVLADLGGPKGLQGLGDDEFAARMAKLYGDLDYLHPFKEGNSRTLRTFTAQLARESGHELDWGTSNVDPVSRDRLYIARDKEVIARAYPGLDQERAMNTDNRTEYEAYIRFVAPFKDAATLQTLVKESMTCKCELSAIGETMSAAEYGSALTKLGGKGIGKIDLPMPNSVHSGKIIQVSDTHIVQKVGKNSAVAHDISKLSNGLELLRLANAGKLQATPFEFRYTEKQGSATQTVAQAVTRKTVDAAPTQRPAPSPGMKI
jgi:cell filamentation protein